MVAGDDPVWVEHWYYFDNQGVAQLLGELGITRQTSGDGEGGRERGTDGERERGGGKVTKWVSRPS